MAAPRKRAGHRQLPRAAWQSPPAPDPSKIRPIAHRPSSRPHGCEPWGGEAGQKTGGDARGGRWHRRHMNNLAPLRPVSWHVALYGKWQMPSWLAPSIALQGWAVNPRTYSSCSYLTAEELRRERDPSSQGFFITTGQALLLLSWITAVWRLLGLVGRVGPPSSGLHNAHLMCESPAPACVRGQIFPVECLPNISKGVPTSVTCCAFDENSNGSKRYNPRPMSDCCS